MESQKVARMAEKLFLWCLAIGFIMCLPGAASHFESPSVRVHPPSPLEEQLGWIVTIGAVFFLTLSFIFLLLMVIAYWLADH